MQNIFRGLGVALVTPFHTDGTIDYESLRNLVEYQIENGTDFFCVLGTTAETPCLTKEERLKVKTFVVDVVKGRVPILLGVGGNCTQNVVAELKATDFTGIDGILSVVPYYNKPSQEGIYSHFMAIANSVPEMRIVLYNVPGRTGVNMTPQTVVRIAKDAANVVAIKEASGKVDQIKEIIDNSPKGFEVISGDDGLTSALIQLGAVGIISVVGNAVPKQFSTMVHSKLQGDEKTAHAINESLQDLYHLAFVDGNPAGIKALLSQKNLCKNILRLPLVPATPETTEAIKVFV